MCFKSKYRSYVFCEKCSCFSSFNVHRGYYKLQSSFYYFNSWNFLHIPYNFCRLSNAETSQPDGQTVGELYNKLLQLQEEMVSMTENSQKLLEDREEKQHSLDVRLTSYKNWPQRWS